ncbi:MAG: Flp pilus assembly protein CpaB, partial [Eubacterium sp.]|nr:Flp pilus assembly protein CpaB [Eubacterium sp.]
MKKVYLIAVVFALLAGLATYMFASNINKKTTIKDRETVSVVVAIKDIPKNTLISEDMLAEDAGYFQVKSFIKEDATPEYIKKFDDIKEMVTSVDIYAGEQLNSYKFVGTDDPEVGLSFKLSPGKKAYSFQASSTNGVDGYINAGDTVDIITYETDAQGNVKANFAYRGLNVIRVSNNKANNTAQSKDSKISEYSSITVEVNPKQVLKLYEIENSGSFKLV